MIRGNRNPGQGNGSGPVVADLPEHALHVPGLWETLYPDAKVFDLAVEADGEFAGNVFALRLGRGRLGLLRGATLFVPYAPQVRGNEAARVPQVLRGLTDLAQRERCRTIDLNWSYSECDGENGVRALAGEIEPRIEFRIDLTRPLNELLGRYAPGGSKLARAEREGLSIRFGSSWEDLMMLRSMQLSSSSRSAEGHNRYSLPDEGFYRRVYAACLDHGPSQIVFAQKDGRSISGLMFLVHAGHSVVQRGGSTEEAFPLGASRYLHYMLLKHLKDSGCRDVYFGGVPSAARDPGHPEHGLYEFKRAFPAIEQSAFRVRISLPLRSRGGLPVAWQVGLGSLVGRLGHLKGHVPERFKYPYWRLLYWCRRALVMRLGLVNLDNLWWDLRYGGWAGPTRGSRYAHLGAHGVRNVSYCALERLFHNVDIREDDVLVDVGCGMGRALNFWLRRGLRNRLVGLELDERVARKVRERLKNWGNVEIITGDAVANIPVESSVLYLYSPFNEVVMRSLRDRLAGLPRGARRLVILYYAPKHIRVFREDPRWQVRNLEMGVFEPACLIEPKQTSPAEPSVDQVQPG